MGFEITDKQLKRAGLDYWQHLECSHYKNLEEYKKTCDQLDRVFYFTTKTQRTLYDVQFLPGDSLVFGKETRGLEEQILEENKSQLVTIPMIGKVRSLNLANAVSIALYEAARQNQFGTK